MPTTSKAVNESAGGRLVSIDGRELVLKSVDIRAEAGGGIARVVLKQVHRNPHAEPLKVVYSVPLPADGAVAAYLIRIGDRTIRGEIDRREAARQRYEEALLEGRTAGILDQERANLFTLEIGNVPPGAEASIELTIDQKLAWLPDGMWEWRFPTVAPPRYLGANGRVSDASKVTQEIAKSPLGVRAALSLIIRDSLAEARVPESPSHPITTHDGVVTLSDGGVARDRDIVVRWPVAARRAGVQLRCARPVEGASHGTHAYGLLTIVPPAQPEAALPRDLIILLDTSGSMTGPPLEQEKRVARALVDSLTKEDQLEMIAFASGPVRFARAPVATTDGARRKALAWIDALAAGGATEMTSAIHEALRPLRAGAQRQVVLITDGQIGFESEVVRAIRDALPAGSRLHTVGIGSSVNRAMTRSGARAGRGVEIIIDLDEKSEAGAARLVAATRAPLLIDVEVTGSAAAGTAPQCLPDLLSGSPLLASVRLAAGGGELIVRGRTRQGEWTERLTVPVTASGEGDAAAIALYGREAVEDLELDLASGSDRGEIDRRIERIGLDFGIATRLTSWVAVATEPGVDPKQPVRIERIPQEMAYGLSAEGLGLRGAVMMTGAASAMASLAVFQARVNEEYEGDYRPEARMDARLHPSRATEMSSDRWPGLVIDLPGRFVTSDPPILEFELTSGALQWHPDARLLIGMRDGAVRECEIRETSTTRPGSIETGTLVRVGLMLERHLLEHVKVVEIRCGGVLLRILL